MKKIFVIAGLLLLSYYAKSQGEPAPRPVDPTNQHITPPAPDVWQFAKYGDYPVSRETGVPNISIPLYEIKEGELSLPISVSYHASGIRVDDIASWVGLGWTLNAGGVVSRTVKGLPDESGNGILNLSTQHFDYFDSEGVIDLTKINWSINPANPNYNGVNHLTLRNMMNGIIDSEPDVFSYNIDGYSGKFFLDPQRNAIAQPRTDLKIQVVIENLPIYGDQIARIIMITPDGKKYTFQESAVYTGPNSYYRNSWYLTRIENSNNTDAIDLYYKNLTQADVDPHRTDTYNLNYIGSEGGYALEPVEEHLFSHSEGSYSDLKVLDRITFNKGKVVFNSADTRTDSYTTRLTSIDIYDYSALSTPIKSWIFDNSGYFISNGTAVASLLSRMKLTSLREKSSDGQLLPPHEFSYLETGTYELPPRLSYAQDYWGYYNGKLSNPSLVPRYQYQYVNLVSHYLGNADRNPDRESMKAGIIHKIKYPTGGVTEFTFEANDIVNTYSTTPTSQPYFQASVYDPSSNTSDIDTFTPTQNVSAVVHMDLQSSVVGGTVTGQVYVRAVGSPNYLCIRSNTDVDDQDFIVPLVAGVAYEIFAQAFGNTTAFGTIRWDEIGTPVSVMENKVIGGLRVKNIKNFGSDGALLKQKHFSYMFPTNAKWSSGQYTTYNVVQPINYLTTVTHQRESVSGCYPGGVWDTFVSMTSMPRDKTGMPVSNVVTYEFVTERDEENQNLKGKTIFQYDVQTKDQDINSITSNWALDRGWLRGQLLIESHYNNANKLVRQVKNTYEEVLSPNRIKGLRVSEVWKIDVGPTEVCFRYLIMNQCIILCEQPEIREIRKNQLFFRTYDEKISLKRLTSTTEMVDGVSQTTTFEYDPLNRHTNIVASQTTNSKNQTLRSELRYAHEMANTTMITKNMVGIALEYDEKVNGVITSGSRITYGNPPGSTLFLPIKFEEKLSNLTYKEKYDLLKVSSIGRTAEVKTVNGLIQAYVYGYNNQVLIANAVNANESQIAFTSFESNDSEGGWTFTQPTPSCPPASACISGCPSQITDPAGYAQCVWSCNHAYDVCMTPPPAEMPKTGRKSFSGSAISKSNLPSGNYKVSFWAKLKSGSSSGTFTITGVSGTQTVSPAAWQYFEYTLSSITSVTMNVGGLQIDEIRLHPVGSQMTTYTANPLTGITTQTDANNLISYFGYDTFGRLESIRDPNNALLKTALYHYRQ